MDCFLAFTGGWQDLARAFSMCQQCLLTQLPPRLLNKVDQHELETHLMTRPAIDRIMHSVNQIFVTTISVFKGNDKTI